MSIQPIHITRTTIALRPDQSRVLIRPFDPGDRERIAGDCRADSRASRSRRSPAARRSAGRVLDAPSTTSAASFWNDSSRSGILLSLDGDLSEARRLLIGSYFRFRVFTRVRRAVQSVHCSASGPVRRPAQRVAVYPQPAGHRGRAPLLHHISHRHDPRRRPDRSHGCRRVSSANRARFPTRCTREPSSSGSCTSSGWRMNSRAGRSSGSASSFNLDELRCAGQTKNCGGPTSRCRTEQSQRRRRESGGWLSRTIRSSSGPTRNCPSASFFRLLLAAERHRRRPVRLLSRTTTARTSTTPPSPPMTAGSSCRSSWKPPTSCNSSSSR